MTSVSKSISTRQAMRACPLSEIDTGCPAAIAARCSAASVFPIEADAIKLHAMIDEAEAQRLLDVNLGYEPAQPGDDKHHTAEPEEAAADTLARVEAEKKSKKK